MAAPRDFTPLQPLPGEAAAASGAGGAADKPRPLSGFKVFLVLFFTFLLVVSNVYTEHVLGMFSGATAGRNPTAFGTVLQGLSQVLFYIIVTYMIQKGAL